MLFSKDFDVEHIIPKTRLFDDSFSNKTLCEAAINRDKSSATAMDFMHTKYGADSDAVAQYTERVERFFKKTNPAKYKKLMMKEADIPDGFIERDLRNTQYIARMSMGLLRQVARTVTATTGSVTDRLRQDWQLINVLQELNWEKYEKAGLTYTETNKDGAAIGKIKDWTKRNDHRHHAMDAIAVAFTRPSHIQYLNYLNARRDEDHKKHKVIHAIEQKETDIDSKKKRYFKPPMEINLLRDQVKCHLEATLISFKAKNKVTTWNVNKSKTEKGYHRKKEQTPRGQLHKETVYGKQQVYVTKLAKVGPGFDQDTIAQVAKKSHRQALLLRLHASGGDPSKAFGGKNALSKNPIWLDEHHKEQVPEKVKLVAVETQYTIRKLITPDLKLDKVIDGRAKRLLQERLNKYAGDAQKAFSNLGQDPIWVNGKNGAQLKSVTITGVSNAEALHIKRDLHGKPLLDAAGKEIPTSYVQTGSNHHVAIYRDGEGNLQDDVVPFFEVVERVRQRANPVDKALNVTKGWKFLFTMKQNEIFVFPNLTTGFDPTQIDLLDEANAATIGPNLFRVQKFSKLQYGNTFVREYVFRHHLETELVDSKEMKDITFKNIKSLGYFDGMQKVRIDHLGRIVHVGEY